MKIGVRVLDAMTKDPVVVALEITISDCAKIMEEKHVGSLLVKDEKKHLVGIITEQDIVRKVVSKKLNPESAQVSSVMETNIFTISEKEDLYNALVLMRDKNIRHLPVVQNGELIGFLTIKDILKIQPQLFELIVEKFELREEFNKPVFSKRKIENDCEICGNYSKLNYLDYKWICDECLELNEHH